MSAGLLILLLAVASFVAAMWMTKQLRVYAVRVQMIDQLNARGSHSTPTPRGGGVSIVIVATLGLIASAFWFSFPVGHMIGLVGGGLIVALIGWLDDHGHIAPAIRLAAHFAGAAWAVAWIGPLSLNFLPLPANIAPIVQWPVTIILAVWLINLYNFMDGIDGIAGSEAVSVALGGALVLAGSGGGEVVPPLLLLAAASLGFLCWNWPPARIFMGDGSSGFLGLVLGSFTLVAAQLSPAHCIAWLILLGVFVVDATVTLGCRLLRAEPIHKAHRSHAYQLLARRHGHLPVTLGVVGITWLWLFPLACLVVWTRLDPLVGISLAYMPLVSLALAVGAGSRET